MSECHNILTFFLIIPFGTKCEQREISLLKYTIIKHKFLKNGKIKHQTIGR